ncbi:MAG: hypothetical protein LBE92_13095 [Chryseobacterium sp.]|uniref:hypothetical protein n=1 Tax=Chryseobacterium sp. TaxID=1871047 RepID=UPI0028228E0F|nr:hypothetical protein [Chryseobacterium sp.]MDR2237050.1 hypothetical protein [Chryseobacterium sp.]
MEKNEIQKIGMLFYPVNRFYDDCCLYFNHDIFINDWDKDMYASNFKVFSVLQFDGEKNILKGIYQYKGNILSKISYYKDNEDVEFYKEELVKTTLKYNLYHFRYSAINEKYIIRGSHFRNKVNRVVKAIYKEENMSDGDKSNTEILNYPYPKVEMINE